MSAIKAFLFDMDGLLIDTEDVHMRAFSAVANELGYPSQPRDFVCWIGKASRDLCRWLAEQLENTVDPEEILRLEWAAYHRILVSERPRPLCGVRELFDAGERLNLKRGLVSSSFHAQVEPTIRIVLEHLEREPELEMHFEAIVTGDRVRQLKPHPEPYLKAAAELGLRPDECLVFEDSPSGVRSARAAGCKVIAIPSHYLDQAQVSEQAHRHFASLTEAYLAEAWKNY